MRRQINKQKASNILNENFKASAHYNPQDKISYLVGLSQIYTIFFNQFFNCIL